MNTHLRSQQRRLFLAITTIAASSASLAQPVADTTGTPTSRAQIEEVTVYAQRREQSVQDVPVSITAYSGDLLERVNIVELDSLSDITPGLVIQEQSPNNPGFVIRGITSDDGSAQSSPNHRRR